MDLYLCKYISGLYIYVYAYVNVEVSIVLTQHDPTRNEL